MYTIKFMQSILKFWVLIDSNKISQGDKREFNLSIINIILITLELRLQNEISHKVAPLIWSEFIWNQ